LIPSLLLRSSSGTPPSFIFHYPSSFIHFIDFINVIGFIDFLASINAIDAIDSVDSINFDYLDSFPTSPLRSLPICRKTPSLSLLLNSKLPPLPLPLIWYYMFRPSARDEIRTYNVLKIYAVCHPKSAASGTGKTNHWTLSFDVGNGQGVRLDIQPNPLQTHTNGGMKAQIIVSRLNYVVTNNAERYDPVSVTYSRPVSWYIDYLASGGRFRYAFTSEGIGCRQWIRDILKLLADIGEVNSSDCESARRSLGRL
jgi:hypothetical protein